MPSSSSSSSLFLLLIFYRPRTLNSLVFHHIIRKNNQSTSGNIRSNIIPNNHLLKRFTSSSMQQQQKQKYCSTKLSSTEKIGGEGEGEGESLSKLLASKIISLISSSSSTKKQEHSKEEPSSNKNTQLQCTIAIAGGGSTSISSLTSIPNSSRILLEGNTLYSKRSLIEYISPKKAPENFSSAESAMLLSCAALKRSYNYLQHDRISSIGIGCASSLKSENERQGRVHKCHVRLSNVWGNVCGYDSILNPAYSRSMQEEMCSSLVLFTVIKYLQKMENNHIFQTGEEDDDLKEVLSLAEEKLDDAFISLDYLEEGEGVKAQQGVKEGAESILSNESDAVLLLPDYDNKMKVIQTAQFLPKHSIILPGSFNPIHIGHISLAKAAFATLHTQDDDTATTPLVLFEISVLNADKPPLQIKDVIQRVDRIQNTLQEQDLFSNQNNNWGVLLTSSPLFSQKVTIFQNVLSNYPSHQSQHSNTSTVSFVIGADTFVRILSKKYYNDNFDNMIQAIREMKFKGVQFVIGGRSESVPGTK